MSSRDVLVVRLDSMGDVLLAGPAVRAAAGGGRRVTMLVSSRGEEAARLLPGVDDVIVFDAGWVLADPGPFRSRPVRTLVRTLRRRNFGHGLVLVSAHQSPLATALLLRLAGVGRITAESHDYAGALLDVRLRPDAARHGDGRHEAQRALAVAVAAGFEPAGDRLAVRGPLPDVGHLTGPGAYLVVHPGSDAPARAWPAGLAREAVRRLALGGSRVLVTGGPDETALAAFVAGEHGRSLAGRTALPELAAVLRGAGTVVVGNTGPAHLAAAVGTPVVSLFSPVVPQERWRPHGVPVVVLGDQEADCAGTRARVCPLGPAHPCLSAVSATQVVAAVRSLCPAAG